MFKNMKKPILIGLICEVSLALLALACLIVAAVFGKIALVIGSAIVMLALLYMAVGFVFEHFNPGNAYYNWIIWFWNVFIVEWTWKIFLVEWTWKTFIVEWTWKIFCVKWIWNVFCKKFMWKTVHLDKFWQVFCVEWVWNVFCKKFMWKTVHLDKFWQVFCVKWVWQTFCKAWVWETFCKAWIWEAFCKDRFWYGFCIGKVYYRYKKWDTSEDSKEYGENDPLLKVEDLCQYFPMGKRELHAVDHVSFDIKKGEVFGLVGESGCGKTTTGRSIIKIYDITGGNVYFKGQRICAGARTYNDAMNAARKQAKAEINALCADTKANPDNKPANDEKIATVKANLASVLAENREKIARAYHDHKKVDKMYAEKLVKEIDDKYLPLIAEAKASEDAEKLSTLKKEYKKERHIAKNTRLVTQIQMIFQDPVASLNPRMTVREIIAEGLVINGIKDQAYIDEKVYEILELVGLVREHAGRYPHEFSGGQKQRIGIARSVIMNPEMIIADEPVSALDVSIQAQVINLLNDLKEKLGLTILFIAHDLSVVKYFSDRIGVMYFGKMVELASSDELFAHPLHPYTKSLLSAIPLPDPISEKTRTRITYNAIAEHDYSVDKPSMREVAPGHFVYCNDAEEIKYKELLNNE